MSTHTESTKTKLVPREGRQEGGCVNTRESETKEGLPVLETAKQDPSAISQQWDWVDHTIWTERMLAALGNGVKGGKWYSLIDKVYRQDTLTSAWEQVKAKRGAAGIDGQSINRFAQHADRYLSELGEDLKNGHYRAAAVRRVDIPKGKGKTRPLGIPTVKDRVVQTAVKRVIEPIFEHIFLPMSYGFRPGRSCKDALREVDRLIKGGYTHVVDADLASYFDSIPRQGLAARLAEHIGDGRILALLDGWLQQDIVKGLERWTPTGGTPQGAVISPLLANLYLHSLDDHLHEQGYRMVRYADDFVIMCRTAKQAEQALEEVRRWVEANGLKLHPDKTHIGDCRKAGQGFDFLGYRFQQGRRWVRTKSIQTLRDKVREKTRRSRGVSLTQMISELNPILKGWFGYFKHAQRGTFPGVDGFVRRRLRAVLRKQKKRPGMGRCYADHQQWPNSFFAAAGLFTMTEARQKASQSRC